MSPEMLDQYPPFLDRERAAFGFVAGLVAAGCRGADRLIMWNCISEWTIRPLSRAMSAHRR